MAGESNKERSAEKLIGYPLMAALMGRRSRRFGRGMQIDGGPFTYKSEHAPQPLS